MRPSRRRGKGVVLFLAMIGGAGGAACGDDEDDLPECKQVLTSCADPCEIDCGSGQVVGCAGPDYGFEIGENERCCFCTDE